jgi:hypothetical protein
MAGLDGPRRTGRNLLWRENRKAGDFLEVAKIQSHHGIVLFDGGDSYQQVVNGAAMLAGVVRDADAGLTPR